MSAEFHVWDGEEFVAQVCGPREEALTDAMHYARGCANAMIEEVTRKQVYPNTTPTERDA